MWDFFLNDQTTWIRTFGLFVPLMACAGILNLKAFSRLELTGSLLSFLWSLCALALLNPIGVHYQFWEFHVEGGVFLGTPVGLLMGWALLWGALPNLLFPNWKGLYWGILLFILDIGLMPLLDPVVELRENWWVFDGVALLIGYWPGKVLFDLTRQQNGLGLRSFLQMCLFAMLIVFCIPLLVLEISDMGLRALVVPSISLSFLGIQLIFGLALLGLAGLQEFSSRGRGTPFPFDPPLHLVTTGPYAYVRNPMQTSQVLLFFGLGTFFWNGMFVAIGFMALIYSLGFAFWSEQKDLESRFGGAWLEYQKNVPLFLPRWRPWRRNKGEIFLDRSGCGVCAQLATLIQGTATVNLIVRDAQEYPYGALDRMTYRDEDGYEASGVEALGRFMEHKNLAWALLGFFMGLPIIRFFAQILVDAVIPPHTVCGVKGGRPFIEG